MKLTSYVLLIALLLITTLPGKVAAAPKAELWARWQAHDSASKKVVDHSAWDQFLSYYLVTNHPSGINRVRYGAVSPEDRRNLHAYLDRLQQTRVSELNRPEQMAYWINLYNALTVRVVLEHYPVSSIRHIDISPGWLSRGPWGAKLLRIEDEEVSLDDIEHRILRPIWQDERIHYALNCASIGCPDLQPQAFTAANTDALLNQAAHNYVNHPRGVTVRDHRLHLSSIYDWFLADFGGNRDGIMHHLKTYAEPTLVKQLEIFSGRFVYDYDWGLNEVP